MLILWRTLLIVLCCLGVIICYPYHADGAITIMLTWAVITFFIMLGLTIITKAIVIGKNHIFNVLFDIVLVIVFLYILLNIFLQLDGTTPYMKIKQGIYPNSNEIIVGLENLGLYKKSKEFETLQNNINQFTKDIGQIKYLIPQEHKD